MNWLPLISAVVVLGLGYVIQRQLFRSALRKDLRQQKLSMLRQCSVELIGLLGHCTNEMRELHANYQVAASKVTKEIAELELLNIISDDDLSRRLQLKFGDLSPQRLEASKTFFSLNEKRNMIDLLLTQDLPGRAELMSEIDIAIKSIGRDETEEHSLQTGRQIERIRDLCRAAIDQMEEAFLDSL